MILGDFLKALGQIGDPGFRGVLARGIGLTIALLIAVYALVGWLVGWFAPDVVTLPWLGEVTWIDNLASFGSVLLMIVLSVFLMVPVASAFTSMFLDRVADAVERRHYPDLPAPAGVSLLEGLRDTLNFIGLLIVANVVALAVYAFMAATVVLAPFTPLVFWALNGYLLGREYFQLVAMRRIGRAAARQAFARHRVQIWLAGGLMAVPLSIPLVNLLVPVLGAATFTHLYHRVSRAR